MHAVSLSHCHGLPGHKAEINVSNNTCALPIFVEMPIGHMAQPHTMHSQCEQIFFFHIQAVCSKYKMTTQRQNDT